MTTSLAARERAALCDLALTVGAEAPTLCDGWDVRDLLLHVIGRDRPWLAVRKPSPPLTEQPFESLVVQARTPAALFRVAPLETVMNTVEFFVHHEDVRRAQPSWEPRALPDADAAALRRQLGLLGRVLALRGGVPLIVDDGTRSLTLRPGADPVTVSGPVGELVLFLFGRTAVRGLAFDGPDEKVAKLKAAKLGF